MIGAIKSELYQRLTQRLASERWTQRLAGTQPGKAAVWPLVQTAATALHRYGVIYFINRAEAKAWHPQLVGERGRLNDLYREGNERGFWDRAWNAVVHEFVQSRLGRADCATQFVPPNAFAAAGSNRLIIRKKDFVDQSPAQAFACETPKYDLHDFSHLICAACWPKVYGNRYRELMSAPAELKDLVKSPKKDGIYRDHVCDGAIFSHYLTTLYAKEDVVEKDSARATQRMAQDLAAYLLGCGMVYHRQLGDHIGLASPVGVEALAILAENKLYELPASEMETSLFVRGGADGHDRLASLSAFDRLERISNAGRHSFYYERRNVVKHRAHALAYRLTANSLLQNSSLSDWQRHLLRSVERRLSFNRDAINETSLFLKVGLGAGREGMVY